jgi:hypothetical protein
MRHNNNNPATPAVVATYDAPGGPRLLVRLDGEANGGGHCWLLTVDGVPTADPVRGPALPLTDYDARHALADAAAFVAAAVQPGATDDATRDALVASLGEAWPVLRAYDVDDLVLAADELDGVAW